MQTLLLPDPEQETHGHEYEMMVENLEQMKHQMTEQSPEAYFSQKKMIIKNIKKTSKSAQNLNSNKRYPQRQQFIEIYKQHYEQYLTGKQFPKNHEEKLTILVEEQLSLGNTIALFEMVYYFRQIIRLPILSIITQKAYKIVKQKPHYIHLRVLSELIALCGVYSEDIVQHYIDAMIEEQYQLEICILVLTNMGYAGLYALIHVANQDLRQLTNNILDYLSRTEKIIQEIIIPILLNDICQGQQSSKKIAISALNRMNGLLGKDAKTLDLLINLLSTTNSLEKGFFISCLRASGIEGQKILLSLLKNYSSNQKLMLQIISILHWKPKNKYCINIKSIDFNCNFGFLPGTLYHYEGPITPSAFNDDQNEAVLCLKSRSLLAHLQRHLLEQQQFFIGMEEESSISSINNKSLFILNEVISKQENGQILINNTVIKAIINELSNKNPKIRQACINSLGLIGLPEASEAIDKLIKCLYDNQCNNRSMACWALTMLYQEPNKKIINRLVELLKDNFWKVRTSACITIGKIVKEPTKVIIDQLLKCLRDGTINKVTVCECIIQLGTTGQQILLQLYKLCSTNDFKMRQAIIFSFQMINIHSHFVSSVIEELFKSSKENRFEIKALCLETIKILQQRSITEDIEISYLKAKNVLSFYYYFLEDSSPKIRSLASESILSFGSQAQLIFIEGLTQGKAKVRIESAKCLGKLGVQNFRALILGLRDQDIRVKKATSESMLENFNSQQVINYYIGKCNQSLSVLSNLKDILNEVQIQENLNIFLNQIATRIEIGCKKNKMQKILESTYLSNNNDALYQ